MILGPFYIYVKGMQWGEAGVGSRESGVRGQGSDNQEIGSRKSEVWKTMVSSLR